MNEPNAIVEELGNGVRITCGTMKTRAFNIKALAAQWGMLAQEYQAIKLQRDELRAACEAAQNYLSGDWCAEAVLHEISDALNERPDR